MSPCRATETQGALRPTYNRSEMRVFNVSACQDKWIILMWPVVCIVSSISIMIVWPPRQCSSLPARPHARDTDVALVFHHPGMETLDCVSCCLELVFYSA